LDMRTFITNLALFAIIGLMVRPTGAADDTCSLTCCDRCGRRCDCLQKTCQLVCDVKKEKKSCWCIEYLEFCTLMPACPHLCDQCCDAPPHCGKEKCVKKLVKKDYEISIPVYKCVVVRLCPACCNAESAKLSNASANPQSAPTAAPLPQALPVPLPSSNPK
jgi:hypothetical protein